MQHKIISLLEGKRIAIAGFGKEGQSTYHYIRKHCPSLSLTIFDRNEALLESCPFLKEDPHTILNLGEDQYSKLIEFDYVIKSPGLSFGEELENLLGEKLTSQVDLTLRFLSENVIGITGTKGKSTTTSLIYEVLKAQGKDAYLLGNIGIPIFDNMDSFTEESLLVIELSALQLKKIHNSPHIAILLNLFEEHLDFFHTKEKYYQAKLNIFEYQKEEDFAIYCTDNENIKKYKPKDLTAMVRTIGSAMEESHSIYLKEDSIYEHTAEGEIKLYDTTTPRLLKGSHNLYNIMATLQVASILGLSIEKALETIGQFKGLEHRLEYVGEVNGILYYNDTIATIPEAVQNGIIALETVDTLIFGGLDRGIDYQEFTDFLTSNQIRNYICMPDTGTKIGAMIKKNSSKNVFFVDTLEEAVLKAKEITEKGKICLLSPAAPSYNCFKNFEEKGRIYKELVLNEQTS